MQPDLQPSPPSPEIYLDSLFDSDDARAGHIIRLSHLDMERFVGRDRFLEEIEARGYTAFSNRNQIYVLCNKNDVRLIA